MFNWDLFPWTDYRGINLDWIIRHLKEVESANAENADAIKALERGIGTIPGVAKQPSLITVAKSGGMFTSINAAITEAKKYCTTSNRVVLLIDNSTYIEDVNLAPNPGIDMVGLGTTIQSANTGYPNTALYTAGQGYFQGITFRGVSTYAVHVEVQGLANTAGNTIFRDCNFYSTANSAVGAGIGLFNNLMFSNCLFNTPSNIFGAYLHNYPGTDSPVTASFDTCDFATGGGGAIMFDDAAAMANPSNVARMFVSIRNCTAYLAGGDVVKFRNTSSGPTYKGVLTGGNIVLRDCHGNNADSLNYMQGQQFQAVGSAYYRGTVYDCVFPCALAKTTTITPVFITVSGVGTTTDVAGVSVTSVNDSVLVRNVAIDSQLDKPAAVDCNILYSISFTK